MMWPSLSTLRGVRGFTFVELLVAFAVFSFVIAAAGSLYLSSKQALAQTSAESFLQRQGTMLQEELQRHVLRATAAQVQTGVSKLCGASGFTPSANQSMLYERFVISGGAFQPEYWCVYRHQPSGKPFPSLYRCAVAGNSPPQDCTSVPAQDLLAGAVVPGNEALSVANAVFKTFVPPGGLAALTTTVDIRFDLDLRRITPSQSMLFQPRQFQFNTTVRN